jgi:hypothetical protein
MGILGHTMQFVIDLKLPKGFSVLELGDQWVTHGVRRLAKDWYKELGCGRYESIDGNGRATVTHDLNRPLPPDLARKLGEFDLVTDFGTGEHCFDQRAVWQTIHYLTKVQGFIIFDRASQGYPEHGFYLTHRCLYEGLADANDYKIIRLERSNGRNGGELIRGIFQKVKKQKFRIPQQGRYKKILRPIMETKVA